MDGPRTKNKSYDVFWEIYLKILMPLAFLSRVAVNLFSANMAFFSENKWLKSLGKLPWREVNNRLIIEDFGWWEEFGKFFSKKMLLHHEHFKDGV